MPTPKKAYVETYGCQMNISDGELMSGILASNGYELVETPEEAEATETKGTTGNRLKLIIEALLFTSEKGINKITKYI